MRYIWEKNVEVLKATKNTFFKHVYELVVALQYFPKLQGMKLIWERLGRLFAKLGCLSYVLERPFWENAFAVTSIKIPSNNLLK